MKRGSVLDVVNIFLFLFVLVFIFFTLSTAQTYIHQGFNNMTDTAGLNGTFTDQIMTDTDNAMGTFVGSIPFVVIGSGILSIVLAFFVPASPIFLVLSIILLVIYEVLSAVFANILYNFITDSFFISVANANPLLVLLIEKLPLVIGVITLVIIIVQYTKSPTGESMG